SGGGGGMMGGGGTGSMMGGGGAMPNFRPLAHAIRGIRLRVVSPPLVATGHGRVRPLRFDFGGYTPNGWSGTPLRGAVNPAAA
ncbi:MAG: hypothetical protein HY700_10270, partial [Gemmatimonadetes bacterium]|nr:hypothetical protein [Gemmatimonadota bacterium]